MCARLPQPCPRQYPEPMSLADGLLIDHMQAVFRERIYVRKMLDCRRGHIVTATTPVRVGEKTTPSFVARCSSTAGRLQSAVSRFEDLRESRHSRFSGARSGSVPKAVLGESRGASRRRSTGYNAVSKPEKRLPTPPHSRARRALRAGPTSRNEASGWRSSATFTESIATPSEP